MSSLPAERRSAFLGELRSLARTRTSGPTRSGERRASLRPFRRPRLPVYSLRVKISVVLITHNEESNLGRTLESVKPLVRDGQGEIIVVDSGSTDRTVEIAKSFGAKVFVEPWKGYAAQKNSAIEKAAGDWILSLDADEELSGGALQVVERISGSRLAEICRHQRRLVSPQESFPRTLDPARRLLSRPQTAAVPARPGRVLRPGGPRNCFHQWPHVDRRPGLQSGAILIHHSYPTLSDYIEHMNRYSSLGAEMAVAEGRTGFSVINIAVRPLVTFVYNYFFPPGLPRRP